MTEITELGTEVLELELKRIRRLYRNVQGNAMSEIKREFRWFNIVEYEKEEAYLSKRHLEGWKFKSDSVDRDFLLPDLTAYYICNRTWRTEIYDRVCCIAGYISGYIFAVCREVFCISKKDKKIVQGWRIINAGSPLLEGAMYFLHFTMYKKISTTAYQKEEWTINIFTNQIKGTFAL